MVNFPYSVEFDLTLFWYPYYMHGKYKEQWEIDHYGHKWFLLISIWVIEITILRKLDIM